MNEETDIYKGDPANHVLGRPEEQSARVHAPLPPVKRRLTTNSILADIRMRRQQLEPLVAEYERLEQASIALEEALGPMKRPGPGPEALARSIATRKRKAAERQRQREERAAA
jgi:hypothetical protein